MRLTHVVARGGSGEGDADDVSPDMWRAVVGQWEGEVDLVRLARAAARGVQWKDPGKGMLM